MKKKHRKLYPASPVLSLLMLVSSCTTPHFILDTESQVRQNEIRRNRSGNVVADIFLTLGTAVVGAFTGVYIGYVPSEQNLRKIALQNRGSDSLQVNLLTDRIWKDSVYCDFLDIRIPPGETCRLLVPVGSVYNLYFSNTPGNAEDDEFIRFETHSQRKVKLYPGLTLGSDTLFVSPEPVP